MLCSIQKCTFPKQLGNYEKRSSSGFSGRTIAFQMTTGYN